MGNVRPEWLKIRASNSEEVSKIQNLLSDFSLNTICESARCPNRPVCYKNNLASFLILGNICTRNCKYCNLDSGTPLEVDTSEPQRIARGVDRLDLDHVVITSVTRDDLEDGGASQFIKTVKSIRNIPSDVNIEVLIPDFAGDQEALEKLIQVQPEIIGHNIETVKSLYNKVRPEANYERSLELLNKVAESEKEICVKSGLMVGLGESPKEVMQSIKDLKETGCDILTIGQYLKPPNQSMEVEKYVKPEIFDEYKNIAFNLGFKCVSSGPLVRSSFKAKKMYNEFKKNMRM